LRNRELWTREQRGVTEYLVVRGPPGRWISWKLTTEAESHSKTYFHDRSTMYEVWENQAAVAEYNALSPTPCTGFEILFVWSSVSNFVVRKVALWRAPAPAGLVFHLVPFHHCFVLIIPLAY
jgi:uncharacterized membrane protein